MYSKMKGRTTMKDYIQTAAVFTVFMAAIPCLALASQHSEKASALPEEVSDFTVGVYFTEEKKCESYTLEEYITGAVMAQMPADFEPEALKAQAVLARTYIQRRYESEKESPTPGLHGALISDDERLYQGFFTEAQAKKFYGDNYSAAYERVSGAARSAENYILTYGGEPVIAAFHAASSGHTESAKTAWGQDIPYLQAVESPADGELDGIETTVSISPEEFRERLSDSYSIDFTEDSEFSQWVELTQVNKRGYVSTVSVCGTEIPADEFTDILEISSPCFECSSGEGVLIFTSRGFGHLVGMSQYGADAMAEEGADFREILNYYYTGCEIGEISGRNSGGKGH